MTIIDSVLHATAALAVLSVLALTPLPLVCSSAAIAAEADAMRQSAEKAPRARAKGQGGHLRRADADRDGYLSRIEAQQAVPRLARQFDAIDANHDGRLSAQEIRSFGRSRGMARAGGRAADPSVRIDAAFAAADRDGDGQLSRAEAESALPRVASKFGRMDSNGDGQLSADEFRDWIARRKAARGPKS